MRSLPAWAPAGSHTGRSQAHHVSSVCGNPPSSNDKFATRLPLSDQGREAQETSAEKRTCLCVSFCLRYRRGANYLLLREQLCLLWPFHSHTPPTPIPPPQPRPQKHLSLNMQSTWQRYYRHILYRVNIYQHQTCLFCLSCCILLELEADADAGILSSFKITGLVTPICYYKWR